MPVSIASLHHRYFFFSYLEGTLEQTSLLRLEGLGLNLTNLTIHWMETEIRLCNQMKTVWKIPFKKGRMYSWLEKDGIKKALSHHEIN